MPIQIPASRCNTVKSRPFVVVFSCLHPYIFYPYFFMIRRVIYFCHLSRVCAITRRCLSGRIAPWGLLHPGGAQPHPWIGEPRLHTAFYVPLVESNLSAVVYLRHAAFSVQTPDGFMTRFLACSRSGGRMHYCLFSRLEAA